MKNREKHRFDKAVTVVIWTMLMFIGAVMIASCEKPEDTGDTQSVTVKEYRNETLDLLWEECQSIYSKNSKEYISAENRLRLVTDINETRQSVEHYRRTGEDLKYSMDRCRQFIEEWKDFRQLTGL